MKNLLIIILLLAFNSAALASEDHLKKGRFYCIHLISVKRKKTIAKVAKNFKGYKLTVKKFGDIYGVFLGDFKSYKEAKTAFQKLRPKIKKCCPDAFVGICAKDKKEPNEKFKPKSKHEKFCIQLITTTNLEKAKRITSLFSQNKKAKILKHNNYYTVLLGEFYSFKQAEETLTKLQSKLEKCCPDSFIRTCSLSTSNTFPINKQSKIKKIKVHIKNKNSPQSNYALLLEKAKICMSKRDCNMAIKYLIQAIKENPEDPKTYVYLGYAYLHLNKIGKALDAFSKALAIDPFYPEGYAALGYFYLTNKKPKVASIFFEKAFKMKPNNLYYAVNYAISLEESGNLKRSEEIFKELKNKFPFIPEIYFNEGTLYLKEKKWKEALDDFNTFISLTSDIKHYQPYVEKARKIVKQIKEIISNGKIRR